MIVVAGEALVDLVAEGGDIFRAVPGGSPANIALGLARLGAPTQMLTRLSRDGFGARVREHLAASGVGLDLAVTDATEPTPLAVATLDAEGRAQYSFYVNGTADRMWQVEELPEQLPDGVDAFCLGSFALALEPGASLLAALVEREHERGRVTLVLDPNVRPALLGDPDAGRARLAALIDRADVVKASDEDLAWLAPGMDAVEVARTWVSAGPRLVVVTRGPEGAVAVTASGHEVAVPAHRVTVVDTVGAGDAFMSGLVDGLRLAGALGPGGRERLDTLDDAALRTVLSRAALVSAITCGRRGADPPTAAELSA